MNGATAANVRRVIAGHFGVKLDRVVNDARLRDLGADWLDRLELLIVIEDQVPEANISDVVADHIETVGDIIRVVEDSAARPEPQCSKLGLFSS
jgi:acyl carrier protein